MPKNSDQNSIGEMQIEGTDKKISVNAIKLAIQKIDENIKDEDLDNIKIKRLYTEELNVINIERTMVSYVIDNEEYTREIKDINTIDLEKDFFTLRYKDTGNEYQGECKGSQPQGYGVLKYNDTDYHIFEGNFNKGKPIKDSGTLYIDGWYKPQFRTSKNVIYKGEFDEKTGIPNGKGILESEPSTTGLKVKETSIGYFKDGEQCGIGIRNQTLNNKQRQYIGELEKDKENGIGKFINVDDNEKNKIECGKYKDGLGIRTFTNFEDEYIFSFSPEEDGNKNWKFRTIIYDYKNCELTISGSYGQQHILSPSIPIYNKENKILNIMKQKKDAKYKQLKHIIDIILSGMCINKTDTNDKQIVKKKVINALTYLNETKLYNETFKNNNKVAGYIFKLNELGYLDKFDDIIDAKIGDEYSKKILEIFMNKIKIADLSDEELYDKPLKIDIPIEKYKHQFDNVFRRAYDYKYTISTDTAQKINKIFVDTYKEVREKVIDNIITEIRDILKNVRNYYNDIIVFKKTRINLACMMAKKMTKTISKENNVNKNKVLNKMVGDYFKNEYYNYKIQREKKIDENEKMIKEKLMNTHNEEKIQEVSLLPDVIVVHIDRFLTGIEIDNYGDYDEKIKLLDGLLASIDKVIGYNNQKKVKETAIGKNTKNQDITRLNGRKTGKNTQLKPIRSKKQPNKQERIITINVRQRMKEYNNKMKNGKSYKHKQNNISRALKYMENNNKRKQVNNLNSPFGK